jgi:hypothetical protein
MPSTASVLFRLSLQILAATAPHRSTLYKDLRQNASQDTVQPKQRSLEKRGRIYRSGLVAKGTAQAHRFPRHPAEMIFCRTLATYNNEFRRTLYAPLVAMQRT